MIMKTLGSLKKQKIIAIDPSTRSLAYAIMDSDDEIIEIGNIDLSGVSDFKEKLRIISCSLPGIMELHKPNVAVIEEAVYIQNFKTSKLISYIIGHTMGILAATCPFVFEANPIVWKNKIGYKKVTKAEKEQYVAKWGATEAKKWAAKERKSRVRELMKDKYGNALEDSSYNSDEIDALAIGVWYNLCGGKPCQ